MVKWELKLSSCGLHITTGKINAVLLCCVCVRFYWVFTWNGFKITAMSSDSDNNGQGNNSSGSNNDNNSNVSVMAVDGLPNAEIKREMMAVDLPIIEFENPDIAQAKAKYGHKHKYVHFNSMRTHQNRLMKKKKYPKKGYKCTMCKYVAERKWLLAMHRQWHLSERPFKCRICQKRFSSRNKRELHQLKHA